MKRIALYLALAFGLTWTLWGAAGSDPVTVGAPAATQVMAALGMFGPAAGALVTRLLLRRSDPFRLPLRPHFRGSGRVYLAAWLVPPGLTLLGGALYFAVFPAQLDLSFGYLREMTGGALSGVPLLRVAALQMAGAVTFAPLINLVFALGEELGWRGLLYPALRERLSPAAACLTGGVIWGLWHAPMLLRGHNYGLGYPGYPLGGILAMCVFCFSTGVFLFWLTEKSGSVWPAALAHGAVNAAVGVPLLFLPSPEAGLRLLGPTPAGLLAGLPLLAFALILAVHMDRQKSSPPVKESTEK